MARRWSDKRRLTPESSTSGTGRNSANNTTFQSFWPYLATKRWLLLMNRNLGLPYIPSILYQYQMGKILRPRRRFGTVLAAPCTQPPVIDRSCVHSDQGDNFSPEEKRKICGQG